MRIDDLVADLEQAGLPFDSSQFAKTPAGDEIRRRTTPV